MYTQKLLTHTHFTTMTARVEKWGLAKKAKILNCPAQDSPGKNLMAILFLARQEKNPKLLHSVVYTSCLCA